MPGVNRNYVQLRNMVKPNRWQSNVLVFTVHVSTKSAQTLSRINKLYNADTEGFFPSLRANTDTLKQQVKYCRVSV